MRINSPRHYQLWVTLEYSLVLSCGLSFTTTSQLLVRTAYSTKAKIIKPFNFQRSRSILFYYNIKYIILYILIVYTINCRYFKSVLLIFVTDFKKYLRTKCIIAIITSISFDNNNFKFLIHKLNF